MLSLVQREPRIDVEPEQPEGPAERGEAQLALGVELGRDAMRLGPFVVRPLELARASTTRAPLSISAPARPTVASAD